MTIAFIGLGNMGGPMAANLVKAGHCVKGYDLSSESCAAAAKAGVSIAPSIGDAVEKVAIILTMLPAGAHVRMVWEQLVTHAAPNALLMDCSTIDVASARAVHAMVEKAGFMALDAPVSGGVGGAAAATLTFMVGGSEAAFAAGKPILEAMGKKIVHCGGAGAGQAAKICNNMILGISMIGVCEAFALGEKLGLTHQALYDVASTASGQCWSLTSYCPVPGPMPASPANRDYQPGFATKLMLKDLKLAQEAASGAGAATPMGAAAAQLYALFAASGAGEMDFSAIITMLREKV